MPPLMPENEDAEMIYLAVCDQYIMAPMGGPVALSQTAIHQVMDLYEVEDKPDCFEKVVELYRHMIREDNEKRQTEND